MIHPTAIIHPGARLGAGVSVGAYSIIDEHVEIGDNTRIGPHVVITGNTKIGCDNRIFQFCSLGEIPQGRSSNFPTLGGCHCSGRRVPVAA